MQDQTPTAGARANERLTALASAALLPLLVVVLAVTPRLDMLLTVHVFVGVMLVGPLVVKLGSVGYRFVRYYAGSSAYVRKGPPRMGLRLLAIPLVLTTVVEMGSGIGLLVTGPEDPGPFLFLHNATFLLWLPIAAIHVLAYVRRLPALVREEWTGRGVGSGRIDLSAGAVLAGLAGAIVALPIAAPWAPPDAFYQGLGGPIIAGVVLTAVALGVTGVLTRRPATR
jgi:hypothetical protein